jgi:large subunit ribosomal protein L4
MPTVTLRTPTGGEAGTVDLDEAVFGIEPNVPVLHQVVVAQLAARRSGTQSTKTRSEVSGGGQKPYRQKGTGRARQGSTRAPHYTGGGIALGPKPRSYKQRTPKKMVNLALRSALSDRASVGRVLVLERWAFDAPRTKDAITALAALGVTGTALVVVSAEDEGTIKSFRNLPQVQLCLVGELNAYDVLCNEWVVFTREVLPTHKPVNRGRGEARQPSPSASQAAGGRGTTADLVPTEADPRLEMAVTPEEQETVAEDMAEEGEL